MKESYNKILAKYAGPKSYADDVNIGGLATAGVHAGPAMELRFQAIPCADNVKLVEGNIETIVTSKIVSGRSGIEGLEHVWIRWRTRSSSIPYARCGAHLLASDASRAGMNPKG